MRPARVDFEPETPPWAVGWVYLFNTPIQFQKIGFSREPARRVREHTKLPFDVWVEHAFPVGTRNVETRLHGFFAPRRARGEWFSLGRDGIDLVRSIPAARSTASLPAAFRPARYLAPFAPAVVTHQWAAVADEFAARLTALRVGAGLTHEQLSGRTGFSPHQLRNYEQGLSGFLAWNEVVRLADALAVPTDAFRGE